MILQIITLIRKFTKKQKFTTFLQQKPLTKKNPNKGSIFQNSYYYGISHCTAIPFEITVSTPTRRLQKDFKNNDDDKENNNIKNPTKAAFAIQPDQKLEPLTSKGEIAFYKFSLVTFKKTVFS